MALQLPSFFYFRDKQFKELGASFKPWIWVLAVVRFLAVSFLAFLLLSPLIRTSINRVEKPIVVLLQDNSQSVKMKKEDSLGYVNQINSLVKNLSGKYDVKTYSFGSSVTEGLPFSFSEKTTNMSLALDQIANIYTNQNLGAVILASDGIYNEGSNPAYLNEKLHAPVYTIGPGGYGDEA